MTDGAITFYKTASFTGNTASSHGSAAMTNYGPLTFVGPVVFTDNTGPEVRYIHDLHTTAAVCAVRVICYTVRSLLLTSRGYVALVTQTIRFLRFSMVVLWVPLVMVLSSF
jgi:hypothetical protein